MANLSALDFENVKDQMRDSNEDAATIDQRSITFPCCGHHNQDLQINLQMLPYLATSTATFKLCMVGSFGNAG